MRFQEHFQYFNYENGKSMFAQYLLENKHFLDLWKISWKFYK